MVRTFLLTAALATSAIGNPAVAQSFTPGSITIVTPVGAGGGTDTHARALATGLSEELNAATAVVNMPGAGGFIGATEVANSAADGETLMVQAYGTFLINSLLSPQAIDPLDDFEIIAMIGELYTSAMVRADDDRFETLGDLVAYAQENPDTTMGITGSAAGFHSVAGIGILAGSDAQARPVGFNSGGAVRAALLGGNLDFAMLGIQQLAGFEDDLRVLGLVAEERYAIYPDVPTVQEQGLPFTMVTSPMVVAAPKGTPPAIIAEISQAVEAVTSSEDFQEALRSDGSLPRYLDASEARPYLEGLRENWLPITENYRDLMTQ